MTSGNGHSADNDKSQKVTQKKSVIEAEKDHRTEVIRKKKTCYQEERKIRASGEGLNALPLKVKKKPSKNRPLTVNETESDTRKRRKRNHEWRGSAQEGRLRVEKRPASKRSNENS